MTPIRALGIGLIALICVDDSVCLGQVSGVVKTQTTAPTTTQAPAKPKVAPRPKRKMDDEPKVLSAEESAKRAKRLADLNDSDQYSGKIDWSEVPPWKQVGFYGTRTVAQTVVFVVDCSESMADESRLTRAKRELRRSVMSLQFPQRFMVIFYNHETIPMPGNLLKAAEIDQKERLNAWLRMIEPEGGTDPRLAVKMALGLKPDVVFLLSDGAFPDGAATEIALGNRRRIPIHCIDLAGGDAGDDLRRIAKDSGGTYVSRP